MTVSTGGAATGSANSSRLVLRNATHRQARVLNSNSEPHVIVGPISDGDQIRERT